MQSVLGINHGGLGEHVAVIDPWTIVTDSGSGVVSWDAPTTTDIWDAAALLAQSSDILKQYIMSDSVSFSHVFSNQIDIGLWTVGTQTLVLATNLNYANETFDLATIEGLATTPAAQVLNTGATLEGSVITFTSVGTGGWILG